MSGRSPAGKRVIGSRKQCRETRASPRGNWAACTIVKAVHLHPKGTPVSGVHKGGLSRPVREALMCAVVLRP